METNHTLLDGILAESKAKADKMLSDARVQVQRIESDAKRRADEEISEEDRQLQSQLQQIRFHEQSALESAKRRAQLKRIDDSYQMEMAAVRRRFEAFARTEAFRPYLTQWVAEAAVGLDLKEAKVAFNPAAPVDEDMLRKAEAMVKSVTGSEVKLSLDTRPMSQIGVVLSSLDDKVSFNNQVDVRMRRVEREIRTLVQEHSWKAE